MSYRAPAVRNEACRVRMCGRRTGTSGWPKGSERQYWRAWTAARSAPFGGGTPAFHLMIHRIFEEQAV
jgi:hypothetical protein